jgi:hypothetical protein
VFDVPIEGLRRIQFDIERKRPANARHRARAARIRPAGPRHRPIGFRGHRASPRSRSVCDSQRGRT